MSDVSELERFWEERYQQGKQWSGNANGLLVDEVEGLEPGIALDLGCGEGGDAVWLARHGWMATGVDVAAAALALAAEHAEQAGVGEAITWERHDLGASFPEGSFDLVSACYLHSPVEIDRSAILRRAADAVAPGGHLLVVGHAGPPSWSTPDHPFHEMVLPTPEDVLADLDLPEGAWRVLRSEVATQPSRSPEGEQGTRPDNVLHLQRTDG